MKRFMHYFIAVLLATTTSFAQTPPTNLYWTMRINVKLDKKLEWEKKLGPFMKTHYPTVKYRVWETLTGPNSGSFLIAIGPMTTKELDTPFTFPKGEALMRTDGQSLDALCESTEVNHFRRVESISNMKADRKLKYAQAITVEILPGSWPDVLELALKNVEAGKKGGAKGDIDVFRPASSGLGNAYMQVRYMEKLEELDIDEKFGDMYDAAFGNNAFYKANKLYYSMVRNTWLELRVLRADLSVL